MTFPCIALSQSFRTHKSEMIRKIFKVADYLSLDHWKSKTIQTVSVINTAIQVFNIWVCRLKRSKNTLKLIFIGIRYIPNPGSAWRRSSRFYSSSGSQKEKNPIYYMYAKYWVKFIQKKHNTNWLALPWSTVLAVFLDSPSDNWRFLPPSWKIRIPVHETGSRLRIREDPDPHRCF